MQGSRDVPPWEFVSFLKSVRKSLSEPLFVTLKLTSSAYHNVVFFMLISHQIWLPRALIDQHIFDISSATAAQNFNKPYRKQVLKYGCQALICRNFFATSSLSFTTQVSDVAPLGLLLYYYSEFWIRDTPRPDITT